MIDVPDTRYAKSGDVHIAYQVHGEGPVDLVLVPPALTHLDLRWEEPGYTRLLRRLESFTRVISLDKRGSGLSDRTVALPTAEEQVSDITAVMDAVGSERACLLGGLDGGVACILHTGEIEMSGDGDEVRGIAVHIGARVAAAAEGSQVLVSRTVVDLVAGSGLEFEDRGAHELKGVPGDWQLYAVKG